MILQIFFPRAEVLGVSLKASVALLQLVLKRLIRLMLLRLLPACHRKVGEHLV